MCTAISMKSKHHYFGRNLDLEHSYNEEVVVTPRSYSFHFRNVASMDNHLAMIGMATVIDGYPLYYEATNEFGLSMAGLNFPGNAFYFPTNPQKDNISPFEFIPWILCQCKSIPEAYVLLSNLNLTAIPFSNVLPLTPLHWIISDKTQSIVVESTKQGLTLHDNPIGILTNNPPFAYHLQNLCNYRNLTNKDSENRFTKDLDLEAYSRGMGALGLPGDLSSASRFVRAAFIKLNSVSEETENGDISQFFHILDSVAMVRGSLIINGMYDITIYSSCCDTDRGIYYYTTYGNRQITGIDMHKTNLNEKGLFRFPLATGENILMQN